MDTKQLLTTREIAAYLKINEKKVYQLIQEGTIPCTRVVGKWLFPMAQVNRWLEKEKLSPHQINGYNTERTTHLEAAMEILKGDADAGMGIEYTAHLLKLDFIPLVEERFDLITMKEGFAAHPLKDFFTFLEPEQLTLKTENFKGYDLRDCGSIVS